MLMKCPQAKRQSISFCRRQAVECFASGSAARFRWAKRRIGAAEEAAELIPDSPVQLRTLTRIRWVAIVGQIIALTVVHYALGIPVPFGSKLAVVARRCC